MLRRIVSIARARRFDILCLYKADPVTTVKWLRPKIEVVSNYPTA